MDWLSSAREQLQSVADSVSQAAEQFEGARAGGGGRAGPQPGGGAKASAPARGAQGTRASPQGSPAPAKPSSPSLHTPRQGEVLGLAPGPAHGFEDSEPGAAPPLHIDDLAPPQQQPAPAPAPAQVPMPQSEGSSPSGNAQANASVPRESNADKVAVVVEARDGETEEDVCRRLVRMSDEGPLPPSLAATGPAGVVLAVLRDLQVARECEQAANARREKEVAKIKQQAMERIGALTQEKKGLLAKLKGLVDKFQVADAKHKELKQQLTTAKNELAQARTQVDEAKKHRDEMVADHQRMVGDLIDVRTKKEELADTLKNVRAQLKDAEAAAHAARASCDSEKQARLQLQSQWSDLKVENAGLKQKAAEAQMAAAAPVAAVKEGTEGAEGAGAEVGEDDGAVAQLRMSLQCAKQQALAAMAQRDEALARLAEAQKALVEWGGEGQQQQDDAEEEDSGEEKSNNQRGEGGEGEGRQEDAPDANKDVEVVEPEMVGGDAGAQGPSKCPGEVEEGGVVEGLEGREEGPDGDEGSKEGFGTPGQRPQTDPAQQQEGKEATERTEGNEGMAGAGNGAAEAAGKKDKAPAKKAKGEGERAAKFIALWQQEQAETQRLSSEVQRLHQAEISARQDAERAQDSAQKARAELDGLRNQLDPLRNELKEKEEKVGKWRVLLGQANKRLEEYKGAVASAQRRLKEYHPPAWAFTVEALRGRYEVNGLRWCLMQAPAPVPVGNAKTPNANPQQPGEAQKSAQPTTPAGDGQGQQEREGGESQQGDAKDPTPQQWWVLEDELVSKGKEVDARAVAAAVDLVNLDTLLAEHRGSQRRVGLLEEMVEKARQETELVRCEETTKLNDVKEDFRLYRTRAAKVLQQKDKDAERLNEMEAENTSLRQQLQQCQQQIKEMKEEASNRLQGSQGEVEQLQEQLRDCTARHKLLQDELSQSTHRFHSEIHQLMQAHHKAQLEGDTAVAELQSQLAAVQTRSRQDAKERDDELAQLTKACDALKKRAAADKSARELAEGEKRELEDKVAQLQAELAKDEAKKKAQQDAKVEDDVPQLASPPQAPRRNAQLEIAQRHIQELRESVRQGESLRQKQAKEAAALKARVHELERANERSAHYGNLEYLKNIVLQYIEMGTDHHDRLFPVLATLLQFSPEEVERVNAKASHRPGNSSLRFFPFR